MIDLQMFQLEKQHSATLKLNTESRTVGKILGFLSRQVSYLPAGLCSFSRASNPHWPAFDPNVPQRLTTCHQSALYEVICCNINGNVQLEIHSPRNAKMTSLFSLLVHVSGNLLEIRIIPLLPWLPSCGRDLPRWANRRGHKQRWHLWSVASSESGPGCCRSTWEPPDLKVKHLLHCCTLLDPVLWMCCGPVADSTISEEVALNLGNVKTVHHVFPKKSTEPQKVPTGGCAVD